MPAEQMQQQRPQMMAGAPPAAAAPPALDTAQTANQPQAMDQDADTVMSVVNALRNHIFGKGEKGISEQMQQADDLGRVMGEITYVLVSSASEQVHAQGRDMDYDMLMGVATEAIDDLADLAEALGLPIDDPTKEYALLYAQQLYVEQQQPSEEEREIARMSLEAQRESGEVDRATSYIQMRGTEAGSDPFGVAEMQGGKGSVPKMMQQEQTED